jgi:hypothetical protein
VQLLRWLAQQEVAYEPTTDADDVLPRTTSAEVTAHLGLDTGDPLPLQRLPE